MSYGLSSRTWRGVSAAAAAAGRTSCTSSPLIPREASINLRCLFNGANDGAARCNVDAVFVRRAARENLQADEREPPENERHCLLSEERVFLSSYTCSVRFCLANYSLDPQRLSGLFLVSRPALCHCKECRRTQPLLFWPPPTTRDSQVRTPPEAQFGYLNADHIYLLVCSGRDWCLVSSAAAALPSSPGPARTSVVLIAQRPPNRF